MARSYVQKISGPKGLAEITVEPMHIKVQMLTPDDNGKMETFLIDRANAPDDVRNGTFNVALSEDKTRMWDPLPVGGKDDSGNPITYVATYVGMAHAKDELPKPINDEGRAYDFVDSRTGNPVHKVEPASRVFTLRFRILAGKYKGMVVPFRVRYLFRQWEDTKEAMIFAEGGKEWAAWGRQLIATLKVAGFDMGLDTFVWSQDGVATLFALDEILKARKAVVKLVVSKSGWVNKILPGDEGVTLAMYEKLEEEPVQAVQPEEQAIAESVVETTQIPSREEIERQLAEAQAMLAKLEG